MKTEILLQENWDFKKDLIYKLIPVEELLIAAGYQIYQDDSYLLIGDYETALEYYHSEYDYEMVHELRVLSAGERKNLRFASIINPSRAAAGYDISICTKPFRISFDWVMENFVLDRVLHNYIIIGRCECGNSASEFMETSGYGPLIKWRVPTCQQCLKDFRDRANLMLAERGVFPADVNIDE